MRRLTGTTNDDKALDYKLNVIADTILIAKSRPDLAADDAENRFQRLYEAISEGITSNKDLTGIDPLARDAIAEFAAGRITQLEHKSTHLTALIRDEVKVRLSASSHNVNDVTGNELFASLVTRREKCSAREYAQKMGAVQDSAVNVVADYLVTKYKNPEVLDTPDEQYGFLHDAFLAQLPITDKVLREGVAEVASVKLLPLLDRASPAHVPDTPAYKRLVAEEVSFLVDQNMDKMKAEIRDKAEMLSKDALEGPVLKGAKWVASPIGGDKGIDKGVTFLADKGADLISGTVHWDNLSKTIKSTLTEVLQDVRFMELPLTEKRNRVKIAFTKSLNRDFESIFPKVPGDVQTLFVDAMSSTLAEQIIDPHGTLPPFERPEIEFGPSEKAAFLAVGFLATGIGFEAAMGLKEMILGKSTAPSDGKGALRTRLDGAGRILKSPYTAVRDVANVATLGGFNKMAELQSLHDMPQPLVEAYYEVISEHNSVVGRTAKRMFNVDLLKSRHLTDAAAHGQAIIDQNPILKKDVTLQTQVFKGALELRMRLNEVCDGARRRLRIPVLQGAYPNAVPGDVAALAKETIVAEYAEAWQQYADKLKHYNEALRNHAPAEEPALPQLPTHEELAESVRRVQSRPASGHAAKPKPTIAANNNWAQYDALLGKALLIQGDMAATPVSDGEYIQIRSADELVRPPPGKRSIGKFHLSVAPQDVPKAWDLIVDRLVQEKLTAKVITPDGLNTIESHRPGLKGKHIVIYFNAANVGQTQRWQGLINDIEKAFIENGIRPGPETIASDRKIPGSRYIHLEHGNGSYDKNGNATNAWDDGLRGRPDPFHELKVMDVIEGGMSPDELRQSKINRLASLEKQMEFAKLLASDPKAPGGASAYIESDSEHTKNLRSQAEWKARLELLEKQCTELKSELAGDGQKGPPVEPGKAGSGRGKPSVPKSGADGHIGNGALGLALGTLGIKHWNDSTPLHKAETVGFIGGSAVQLASGTTAKVGELTKNTNLQSKGAAVSEGAGRFVVSPLVVVAGVDEFWNAGAHQHTGVKNYARVHGGTLAVMGLAGTGALEKAAVKQVGGQMVKTSVGRFVGGKALGTVASKAATPLIVWDLANVGTSLLDKEGDTIVSALDKFAAAKERKLSAYRASVTHVYTATGLPPNASEYRHISMLVNQKQLSTAPTIMERQLKENIARLSEEDDDNSDFYKPANWIIFQDSQDQTKVEQIETDLAIWKAAKTEFEYQGGYKVRSERFQRIKKEAAPSLARDLNNLAIIERTLRIHGPEETLTLGMPVKSDPQFPHSTNYEAVTKPAAEHYHDFLIRRYTPQLETLRHIHKDGGNVEAYIEAQRKFAQDMELDEATAEKLYITSSAQLERLVLIYQGSDGQKLSLKKDFGIDSPMLREAFGKAYTQDRLKLVDKTSGEACVEWLPHEYTASERDMNEAAAHVAQFHGISLEKRDLTSSDWQVWDSRNYDAKYVYSMPLSQAEVLLGPQVVAGLKRIQYTLERMKGLAPPHDAIIARHRASPAGARYSVVVKEARICQESGFEGCYEMIAEFRGRAIQGSPFTQVTKRIIWTNETIPGGDYQQAVIKAFHDANGPTMLPPSSLHNISLTRLPRDTSREALETFFVQIIEENPDLKDSGNKAPHPAVKPLTSPAAALPTPAQSKVSSLQSFDQILRGDPALASMLDGIKSGIAQVTTGTQIDTGQQSAAAIPVTTNGRTSLHRC